MPKLNDWLRRIYPLPALFKAVLSSMNTQCVLHLPLTLACRGDALVNALRVVLTPSAPGGTPALHMPLRLPWGSPPVPSPATASSVAPLIHPARAPASVDPGPNPPHVAGRRFFAH
jgi:hypothetical protein